MKLHEFQAKEVLARFGVPVVSGPVITDAAAAPAAIAQAQQAGGGPLVVVKAQIHAGGRGKGGGVKVCKDTETALFHVKRLLGAPLITPQTGPEGQIVRTLLITPGVDIEREIYLAVTLDRSRGKHVIIASTAGGMEIEEVAHSAPEKILKEWLDPAFGLRPFQTRRLVAALGLTGELAKTGSKLLSGLVQAYLKCDCAIAEINPLVVTKQGALVALDAKLVIDDNALYRQKDLVAYRDLNEEAPAEIEAGKFNLNYVKLEGNVGCMVNGAGLAMATMDIIKLKGGEPANFLDVGGGANVETVKNGFRIILADPAVKAVLVNIFGGIVRCDRVANGIIAAVKELQLKVPVVVRLEGTNAEEARRLLAESGVALHPATGLDDAANKVVALAKAQ